MLAAYCVFGSKINAVLYDFPSHGLSPRRQRRYHRCVMSDEWSDESVIVVTQHQLFGEVAKFQNVSMSQGGSKFKVI
jgi:hypothetical protein